MPIGSIIRLMGHQDARPKERGKRVYELNDFFSRGLYAFLEKKTAVDTARRSSGVHVSSLFDMCPRAEVISTVFKEPLRDPIPPNLQMIFDHGTDSHYTYQNRYLGPMGVLIGKWRCRRCGNVVEGFMPHDPCECVRCPPKCGSKRLEHACQLCVAVGTIITTGHGEKHIEEVEIGDTVLTHTGKLQTVTDLWREGKADTLAIHFPSRLSPLYVTANHPFFIRDKRGDISTIRASKLRVGSVIFLRDGDEFIDVKVIRIDPGPRLSVMNLTAQHDHSYAANRVLVGNCSRNTWEYEEIRISIPKLNIVGRTDGILHNFPGDRAERRIWEYKTINIGRFRGLTQPFIKDIFQASMYGHCLGIEHAMITYGVKNDHGEPPKSFCIDVDERLVRQGTRKAKELRRAFRKKDVPARICARPSVKRAKECKVRGLCFARDIEHRCIDAMGA